MDNKEAIEILNQQKYPYPEHYKDIEVNEALDLAIKALGHEVYWEDVKQALNGWLNNTTSPNTALNDIYRAYMGKGDED